MPKYNFFFRVTPLHLWKCLPNKIRVIPLFNYKVFWKQLKASSYQVVSLASVIIEKLNAIGDDGCQTFNMAAKELLLYSENSKIMYQYVVA